MFSTRISSAMLVRDRRTSSAKGAFGRHERQDSIGIGWSRPHQDAGQARPEFSSCSAGNTDPTTTFPNRLGERDVSNI
jgi:hypothetical protein